MKSFFLLLNVITNHWDSKDCSIYIIFCNLIIFVDNAKTAQCSTISNIDNRGKLATNLDKLVLDMVYIYDT